MGVRHGIQRQRGSSRAVEQGQIVDQKAPFKLKDFWALRVCLQMKSRVREVPPFYLGIVSKLRGFGIQDDDGDQAATRAVVIQPKTERPVQFGTPTPRAAVQ